MLGNTYHLMLRPGAERIARSAACIEFMRWPYPILTDSGGFQVMSLSALRKVAEAGVTFRSHIDGAMVELTPERSIEVQILLGSDIVMQLDECVRLPAEPREIERAMQLSLRWAERCKRAFERAAPGRALFGIVQGGDDIALRATSAERSRRWAFDGYAIGGLAVGEPQDVMLNIVAETMPVLPAERPRYLMGVDARRSSRGGRPRHRYVRLRLADAERPPWACLHALRADQYQECPSRRGSAAARSGKPLPRRARVLARLPASSFKAGETLGGTLLSHRQSLLLPGPDGGCARCDRGGPLRRLCRADQGTMGREARCKSDVNPS